jgi:uncharacterized Tic20 family protein
MQTNPTAAVPADARTWAAIAHFSGYLGFLIPFGNLLGPFLVWLVKSDGHEFVRDQCREALNFQISISIYVVVALLLSFVLIGLPFVIGLVVVWLGLTLLGAIRALDGTTWRYPHMLPILRPA